MPPAAVRGSHTVLRLESVIDRGRALADDRASVVRYEAGIEAVQPDDLLTIIYTSGTTKRHAGLERGIADMRRILILDDSISGGNAMREARKRVENSGIAGKTGAEIIFGAIYGAEARSC